MIGACELHKLFLTPELCKIYELSTTIDSCP